MSRLGPRRGRGVSRRSPLAGLAVALGISLAAAPRAGAYVRYKTADGVPFFWAQSCIPVSVYPQTMMNMNGEMDMTPAQIVQAASAAAAAWSADANACTFMHINVSEAAGAVPATAKLDYNNMLVFRPDAWCGPRDKDGNCTYPSEALAITSVFNSKTKGQIYDGDIEVNAEGFLWADLVAQPSGAVMRQDLQNALTHEMGHLIGLDHTCYTPSPGIEPPLDNNGNPVPSCDDAPPDVQATTMFASAIPGDIEKRTLAPDDVQAVCDIYPVAEDPMKCPVKDQGPDQGCVVGAARRGSGAGAALAALGLLALAARRRRRSR